jgi:hypothetical protein
MSREKAQTTLPATFQKIALASIAREWLPSHRVVRTLALVGF